MALRLLQIPWSHNCVKARRGLELKGLAYEPVNIDPMDRRDVVRLSGQGLVPVLLDGETAVADSTEILLYLDRKHPEPPLVPADPALAAECLILEDWADLAFMELSRRVAYHRVLSTPGALESVFFPAVRGLRRRAMGWYARRVVRKRFRISPRRALRDEEAACRVSRLAVKRLGGRPHLVGERTSVADIALASMSAPLWAASEAVRGDPGVRALLEWGRTILGDEIVGIYRA